MNIALIWLRRDLRLNDNTALQAALAAGATPLFIYIHDEPRGDWPLGAASAWWLHHSLAALQEALRQHGSDLMIFRGEALPTLREIAKTLNAGSVHWNRCYDPDSIARDQTVKQGLHNLGLDAHSHSGNLLQEPWQLLKKDQTPYRVFTPFWNNLQKAGSPQPPIGCPSVLPPPPKMKLRHITLDELGLLPEIPWDKNFHNQWQPGEISARVALERLCSDALLDYAQDRDRPDLPGTSRLSPHLHFGELSPRQIWHHVQEWAVSSPERGALAAAEAYLRQLAWREFGQHLLYHFPHTSNAPLDTRFNAMPWHKDYRADLRRWQRGHTGIPIVDAGMRELWSTGWMHNRVRMIVASLLTKNLLIPWQEGARWFWDTLVDADLANNSMGWQWVAGCGADAAPYFRIFNPVLQGERFDPDGGYVRRWVPELKQLPTKWLQQPWAAPGAVLQQAGVALGTTYPPPCVDLAQSRLQALTVWDTVKRQAKL